MWTLSGPTSDIVSLTVIGIEKVAAFEKSVTATSGGRDIDIVLRDGRVIETEDWDTWKPEKVDDQFFKDLDRRQSTGVSRRWPLFRLH